MSDTQAIASKPVRKRRPAKAAAAAAVPQGGEPPAAAPAPVAPVAKEAVNPIILTLRLTEADAPLMELAAADNDDNTLYAAVPSTCDSLPPVATEVIPLDVLRDCLAKHNLRTAYGRDTCCFWDCHPFSVPATPLVVSHDVVKNTFQGMGHFCSPACALAYLHDLRHMSNSDRWQAESLMKHVFGSSITPAPPRSTLRMFDGPLAIEQFRAIAQQHAKYQIMEALPPVHICLPQHSLQVTKLELGAAGTGEYTLQRPKARGRVY
jgi:hypothetical protein